MIVYRLAKKAYITDLNGVGAAMFGGRWNKKGRNVLYTGESKEIALLESIVHLPPMLIPKLYLATIEISDNSITFINSNDLPNNWYVYPAPDVLKEITENWLKKSNTIALKVPSCVVHSAHNYILNCSHKDYHKVKLIAVKEFHFDTRLRKL